MSHNHKKNNRRKPVGEELPVDQPQEQPEDLEEQTSQIIQSGSVTMTAAKHVIHCLTIVGQIEGHYILPPQNKTTKYEHVIPQLVAIEQDPSIEGLMIILNTVGGDVEAGLAIAELISGMKKPTVSLVLGGGHSIVVPLACSAKQSFIAPSATMTVHPVRMNGLVLGVPQTFSYFEKMQEKFSLENDIRVSTLSRYPEVLTMEEQAVDEEELWKGLKKALDGAIRQFVETRTSEGEHLREDLIEKLDNMLKLVGCIEERSPQIIAEYRDKLETKVKELLADTQMEDSRIAAEVVIFADKICTDEEVVRLRSHIVHMKDTLVSDDSGIGRKLDFIAQEMNREANTILSKANDLEISNIGIELKTEIEKVREQIQNIE